MKKLNLKTKEIILAGLCIALISVGAFIKVPLFGVPFTLQLLFVMVTADMLKPWLSFFVVGCYVLLGLIGLPVFSGGGGLSYVVSPTFGYILGFLLCSPIVGLLYDRFGNTVKMKALANLIGMIPVYLIGVIYYFFISNIYLNGSAELKSILLFGFVVFLPLDVIYCFIAALIANRLKNIIKV